MISAESSKRFVSSSFFLFSLIFIVKLYVLRVLLLNDVQLLRTVLYELPFLILLFMLIETVARSVLKRLLYMVLNVIVSFLSVAFLLYYDYFGTLMSYHDLKQSGQVASVSDSIVLLLHPLHGLFFIDVPILLLFFFLFRNRTDSEPIFEWRTRVIGMIIPAVFLIVHFFSANEEDLLIPERFAHKYGLFTYEAYQLYFDKVIKAAANVHFTRDDIMTLKGNEEIPLEQSPHFGVAKGRNLILVQLESFQNFALHLSIDGEEITPTMNALADTSFYFPNLYQQIGAGNTSDAEFLANTSLYPVGSLPTSEAAGDKEIPSLPRLLNEEGYMTATFHAHTIEYWNRDELYPALGFEKYYDISYFEETDWIGFGPSDEVFYDGVIELLTKDEVTEPFYAHVLSLTSHSPFTLPADKIKIDLPKMYDDTFVGDYLQSIHYADYALGQFVRQLKEAGLWEQSMIAVYGDHSGAHGKLLTKEDEELLEHMLGHPYTLPERFNVPFIIHIPGVTDGEQVERIGGQIDMMPTLAALLGLSLDDHLYFGQNLLQPYEHNLLGMRYYMPAGSYINEELLYSPATPKVHERIFDLQTRERLAKDEIETDMQGNVLKLLYWSDAYIEQLPVRTQ